MSELRILIITQKVDKNDYILGFFYTWLNKLAKKIDKIYVLALEKGITDLPTNIELYSLGRENGSNRLGRFIKFNYFIAKVLLNKRINIIFTHMCPEYAILAWPYAKLKNIPMVMWYTHKDVNHKLRLAHLLVKKIVSSSKEGFRINTHKLIITGHGIDVDKFKIQNPKSKIQNNRKKTILSVGRISPIKNYETLIEAANILINQKNIRDLKFQIVGGVPLKSQNKYLHFLKNMIREYKLEDYVQFIGPVPYIQIQNYYQNCDLFVSVSNTGSLDKAVLEAMVCGKLVLTSNEAFKDGLGNYAQKSMFKKGNADELAEKIDSLFQLDKESQDELSSFLRNIVVQNHSLDRLIDRLIAIFQSLSDDKKMS